MPCPNCHSHNLWDDQAAWGCNDCRWMNVGSVYNKISPRDRFNQNPGQCEDSDMTPRRIAADQGSE